MKLRNLYFLIFSVWVLDFITTVIGVGFMGFTEQTPIPAYLYSLGWYGWVIGFLLAGLIFFLLSLLVYSVKYLPRIKKDFPEGSVEFITFITIGTIWILEGFVIFNNLGLITGLTP